MFQGIASSTQRTYSSVQHVSSLSFVTEISLCTQMVHLYWHPNGLQCCSLLTYHVQLKPLRLKFILPQYDHCILKWLSKPVIQLSTVRTSYSWHKMIPRHLKRRRLLVTVTVLWHIREKLNFQYYDDILLWVACCTGSFGFLRLGEFTTPSAKFDACVYLAVDNIQIDRHENPKVIFKDKPSCHN